MADSVVISRSKLNGTVNVSGAKNSALRLLAATLLTARQVRLSNLPANITDVKIHLEMLRHLGKKVSFDANDVIIEEKDILNTKLNWEDRSIRNTLLILGGLLARKGEGCVPLPGGCKIGERKYDFHQMIWESLGARVWEENNYLYAESSNKLKGAEINLPFRSVGATENAIICGTLARGKTTLFNPHIQPELFDLINMLNSIGARIVVHGSEKIEIYGVDELYSGRFSIMPDNIEALTWFVAAMITKGEVEIRNFPFEHLYVPLRFLEEAGAKYFSSKESIIVKDSKCYPFEIVANSYPGIKSDLQPLIAPIGLIAKGRSVIFDIRYPERFGYAAEMIKIGADIRIEKGKITIEGDKRLLGTTVEAPDLRGGAALVLAGLISENQTIITNFNQVERGYEYFVQKLLSLEGKIKAG